MKRSVFLLIILIILFSLNTLSRAEGTNLAVNSGFEENDGNDPYFWTDSSWEDTGKFSLDTTQFHSGKVSALITNETPGDSRFKQLIKVKPEKYYKLSCWVKTENVGENAIGANISIDQLTETSADIKRTNGKWEYLELFGVTGGNQDSFTLTLGLGGYGSTNTGKAWFDDVSVEELEGVPETGKVIKLYTEAAPPKVQPKQAMYVAFALFTVLIFLILAAVIFILGRKRFSPEAKNSKTLATEAVTGNAGKGVSTGYSGNVNNMPLSSSKLKLDKKDYVILCVMILIYAVIAIVNLGSLKVPKTSWTPTAAGESIVIDLGREVKPEKVYFYGGLNSNRPNEGKYRIQFDNGTGKYVHMATINKIIGEMYTWRVVSVTGVKARYLKLVVDTPGGTLNELAFFEKGSKTPIEGVKIIEKSSIDGDNGKVENLFDETNTVDYKHTYMTGMIFDEIYHARTAYEFLNRMEPYEWTHPPLGKILISIGIAVFGMNPFGWRIIGTLFGIAMIPLMYLFGKKLFKGRFYAFCAAFLFMFDFMHFSLSRIATIDVYPTFFIILMYYFMYDYFVNKSYNLGLRNSIKPLFLSGLFFGLGAASKWIGIYAGGGLAVLFFVAKFQEFMDYRRVKRTTAKKHQARLNMAKDSPESNFGKELLSASKDTASHNLEKAGLSAGKDTAVGDYGRPDWVKDFVPLYIIRTFLFCLVAFVLIPVLIYGLSYIPFLNVEGSPHGLDFILQNQSSMLRYHSHDVLGATHPFSSYWWQWPLISRPLETYLGSDLPAGMSSTMTIMGNPAIWWFGIFAIVAAIIIALVKKDRKMVVIFTAIAFQYLPWVGVTRIVFIYHFFSTVPFLILSIVYVFKALLEKYREMNIFVYTYLAIVMLLFIMFYPVLSGMEVPRTYVEQFLLWFKYHWVF